MAKLGVAIVGTGSAAEKHASAIARQSELELVAVRSHKIARAREFASTHGDVKAYEEIEYLVENRDVDIVVIADASEEHYEGSSIAIKSGKSVIIESPVTLNINDAENLKILADEYGMYLTPISTLRYDSAIKAIKKAIDNNRFGNLLDISIKYVNTKKERNLNKSVETPILYGVGYECIDLLLYLAGKPTMLSAVASSASKRESWEDVFTSMFSFKDGYQGSVTLLNSAFGNTSFSLEVYGTEGYIRYNNGILDSLFSDGIPIEDNINKKGLDFFYEGYLDSIIKGHEIDGDIDSAILTLKVVKTLENNIKKE